MARAAAWRDETVHEIALDLKIRAKVIAFRRLAAETSQTVSTVDAHGAPIKVIRGYFASACYPSA